VRGGHRLEVSATRRSFRLMFARGVCTPRVSAAGGASSTPAPIRNWCAIQHVRTADSRRSRRCRHLRLRGGQVRSVGTRCQGGAPIRAGV